MNKHKVYQVVRQIKLGTEVLKEKVIQEFDTLDEARNLTAVLIMDTDLIYNDGTCRVIDYMVKKIRK